MADEPDNLPSPEEGSLGMPEKIKPLEPDVPSKFVGPPPLPPTAGRAKPITPPSLPGIPPRKPKKRPILAFLIPGFVGLLLVALLAYVIIALGNRNQAKRQAAAQPVTLTMWGLFDDPAAIKPITNAYTKAHPLVTINYIHKDAATYEFEVTNALAEGRGPDIWQIRNDWLWRHFDKLAPAPAGVKDGYLATYPPIAAIDLTWPRPRLDPATFTVDESTFGPDRKVYAVPWSIDTLALYSNPDLLAGAGISSPPATWDDVITASKALRQVSGSNVSRAGIALGTSNNLDRPEDILTTLMLQNGAVLVDENGQNAVFNQGVRTDAGEVYPAGSNALDFFTSFALPTRDTYTWNSALPGSVQAFANSQTAMMIGYSYNIDALRQFNPGLNYTTSSLPQVRGAAHPMTSALYWANGVNKFGAHPAEAWDFLAYAGGKEPMQSYWQATGRPPARSDLIKETAETPKLGAFIKQIPAAIGYYKGKNPAKMDEAIRGAVDAVVNKGQPLQISIDEAAKTATKWLLKEAE